MRREMCGESTGGKLLRMWRRLIWHRRTYAMLGKAMVLGKNNWRNGEVILPHDPGGGGCGGTAGCLRNNAYEQDVTEKSMKKN